jgi:hypothetical protein
MYPAHFSFDGWTREAGFRLKHSNRGAIQPRFFAIQPLSKAFGFNALLGNGLGCYLRKVRLCAQRHALRGHPQVPTTSDVE